jgi:hypothetical protein
LRIYERLALGWLPNKVCKVPCDRDERWDYPQVFCIGNGNWFILHDPCRDGVGQTLGSTIFFRILYIPFLGLPYSAAGGEPENGFLIKILAKRIMFHPLTSISVSGTQLKEHRRCRTAANSCVY